MLLLAITMRLLCHRLFLFCDYYVIIA